MTVDQESQPRDLEEENLHNGHGSSELTLTPAPLPKFQLFMVLLISFAEPITATVIYPFINQFVRDTGVTRGDERKTGYYAGIIESAFFFAEALTVFHWGWLSDRIGRRPVLLLGPLGLSIATLGFGLSTTFWPLVVYRCFQGIFNGNIGVSKSVIAELTDSTNIGDAFAMLPLMWSTGITVAPIMGGILSNPADTWPSTLGRIALLRSHPYFLPCLAAAIISLSTFLIAFIGLKETLPSAVAKQRLRQKRLCNTSSLESSSTTSLIANADVRDYGSNESIEDALVPDDSVQDTDAPHDNDMKPPPLREILTGSVLMAFANYGFLAFTDMSYQILLPLMFSTSVPYGGLGLDPYNIGVILGIWGLFNAVVQISFLGKVIRKYGARKSYIMAYSAFLICIGMFPITSYFAKRAGGVDAIVVALIAFQLFFRTMISMCYGSMHVVLVHSAPSKAALGSVNGLAQMVGSGIRSIAPTVASSLFSISLERHLAGGYMVYFILFGVTLAGVQASFLLPKTVSTNGR